MSIIPGVKSEMLDSKFWTEKIHDNKKIIMDYSSIKEFNDKTIDIIDTVYDMEDYQDDIQMDRLISYISEYSIPKNIMYDINGDEISSEFYENILQNTNKENIKDSNTIRFGIAVHNTAVRKFPTDEGVFKTKGDIEFDRFQETCCNSIEPVAVLHESIDSNWYFIQMYNYRGWVKKIHIAIAKDKNEIFNYINNKNFLMVIGDFVRCQFNPYDKRVSRNEFYMGTRIPCDIENSMTSVGNQGTDGNYVIKLPVRSDEGNLEFKNALLSRNSDVIEGYLAYTRRNILKQAFKLLGDRYDWGNKNGGRDCSGFIMCVYETFGFRLPRNADEQEIGAGITNKFTEDLSIEYRERFLDKVKPGAGLYMDGHVMMYIGKNKDNHYMIHDFNGYSKSIDGEYVDIKANQVAVTSVKLLNSSHRTFLEAFTSIVHFEL